MACQVTLLLPVVTLLVPGNTAVAVGVVVVGDGHIIGFFFCASGGLEIQSKCSWLALCITIYFFVFCLFVVVFVVHGNGHSQPVFDDSDT